MVASIITGKFPNFMIFTAVFVIGLFVAIFSYYIGPYLHDDHLEEHSSTRRSVYRQTFDQLSSSNKINLRTENGLGVVTTSPITKGSILLELNESAALFSGSPTVALILEFYPYDLETALVIALAIEHRKEASKFAPLWLVTGLDIPDIRNVKLKGMFAETFASELGHHKLFEMIASGTTMESYMDEASTVIAKCRKILVDIAALGEIPESDLRWAFIMIRSFGIRDCEKNSMHCPIVAFAALPVFMRLSAYSGNLEISSPQTSKSSITTFWPPIPTNQTPHTDPLITFTASKDLKAGEEILISAPWLTDAWAFAYRGVWLQNQHRMITNFHECVIALDQSNQCSMDLLGLARSQVLKKIPCDLTEPSTASLEKAAIHLAIRWVGEKLEKIRTSNSIIRKNLEISQISVADLPAVRIREIESEILQTNFQQLHDHSKLITNPDLFLSWLSSSGPLKQNPKP